MTSVSFLEPYPDEVTGVRAALLAEREAYDEMRREVPDLELPVHSRRPMTPRQQEAVDRYHALREELEALRGGRKPAIP